MEFLIEDTDIFATRMRAALEAAFLPEADHALQDRIIVISSSYRKTTRLAQIEKNLTGEKIIGIFLTQMSIAASPLFEGAASAAHLQHFERMLFAHMSSLEVYLWTQENKDLDGKFYHSFLPSHLTIFAALLRRALLDPRASRQTSLVYHFYEGHGRRLLVSPPYQGACDAPRHAAKLQDFSQLV